MMQFTYNNNNQYNAQNIRPPFFGKTDRKALQQITRAQIQQPPPINEQSPIDQEDSEPPKMTWGPPIWLLFHTLAQKVNPEFFPLIREDLLNFINNICTYLPCPVCANHATEYMNNLNFNTIKKKEDLIKMLFDFHNNVNKRKNYPIVNIDDVIQKYSLANTENIIKNFLFYFEKKTGNFRVMSNDLHKKRLVSHFRTWMNNNIQCFAP